ncbi:hypothetical protein Ddc_10236 [Ditylenchus destructor]|nr:hypothetical protein Ddc_10236 [Ditylenchus destructor]
MRLCSESMQKLPQIPAPFQCFCCWKWAFGIWRLLESARADCPDPPGSSSDRNPRRGPLRRRLKSFQDPLLPEWLKKWAARGSLNHQSNFFATVITVFFLLLLREGAEKERK